MGRPWPTPLIQITAFSDDQTGNIYDALKPMIDNVTWVALLLLLAGGILYSTGVIFYVNKRLKFARAIWHGHVVAAAATHWAAVLLGVVLATR